MGWEVEGGNGVGDGIVSEFGMDMYTLLYLKWTTNKELLWSTGSSAQCYVAAWMGEERRGKRDSSIRMTEFLCCPPETVTALSISYTPIQNKKLKQKK